SCWRGRRRPNRNRASAPRLVGGSFCSCTPMTSGATTSATSGAAWSSFALPSRSHTALLPYSKTSTATCGTFCSQSSGRSLRRRAGILLLLWSLALVAGCSTIREPACAAGEQRGVSELLYFGTATPTGVVSDAEWSAFLGNVVTPRFP